jgi:ligand-binding SRPBCC domain-containing protein
MEPAMYTLERAQVVPVPLEVAFRFFEDPRNLPLITPDWLGFRIMSIRGSPLDVGTTIIYRIRWLGVPLSWVTRIDEFERNRRFVDVQIRGPYRWWRHEHTFEGRNGQTLVRDTVRYELPLGILGTIVHRLVVRHQLRDIFEYRASQIRLIFPGSGAGITSSESA